MTKSNGSTRDDAFGGVIGQTYRSSQPWQAPDVRARDGAPNIVMVVLDDVGFAHLGCYGSDIDTPRIDALAARGLRYTNFHTTAMCSPTRASLLTGRNHHAVGMGTIADWCAGYPGYQGQVTHRAATLAEVLRPAGYNCFAVGKWHLMRMRDATAAGPFDHWPLGRGFERYYGFLSALTDQWNPELFRDNHAIRRPQRPDYHLSEDLVDEAIGFIRDQQCAAPGKPFFAYLALGACHSPHHVPRAYIDKYKGRYDRGWDETRRRWYARQLELGVIPRGTTLTELNPKVKPWSTLNTDERRVCARLQEVFAGFLDHTDVQIGRLIDYLVQRKLLDNTLFVLLSDNGASDEGGPLGNAELRKHYLFMEEPFETLLGNIERFGSEYTNNHYPAGWGHAGNTPLKWFKMDTHGGGIRDPLIVHWPAGINAVGEVRTQYHHCSDVMPTILDVLGLEAPAVVRGVEQLPIDGISMVYSFADASAPTRKHVQYYEMLGDRGIWSDGWKAVTRHAKGTDFDQDRWELYHTDTDFSESNDLAAKHPERVKALVELWWAEAERNQVLPLDDRDIERSMRTFHSPRRLRYVYQQGMARIDRVASPTIGNRSYRIMADIEISDATTEGVILAAGGRSGGYTLFVQGGRLVHEYVGPDRRFVIESPDRLPVGCLRVCFAFRKTGPQAGEGTLLVDDKVVATQSMTTMWPLLANSAGVHCGYDDGSPVSERYSCPFTFTGRIGEVVIEPYFDYVADSRLEYYLKLSED